MKKTLFLNELLTMDEVLYILDMSHPASFIGTEPYRPANLFKIRSWLIYSHRAFYHVDIKVMAYLKLAWDDGLYQRRHDRDIKLEQFDSIKDLVNNRPLDLHTVYKFHTARKQAYRALGNPIEAVDYVGRYHEVFAGKKLENKPLPVVTLFDDDSVLHVSDCDGDEVVSVNETAYQNMSVMTYLLDTSKPTVYARSDNKADSPTALRTESFGNTTFWLPPTQEQIKYFKGLQNE